MKPLAIIPDFKYKWTLSSEVTDDSFEKCLQVWKSPKTELTLLLWCKVETTREVTKK